MEAPGHGSDVPGVNNDSYKPHVQVPPAGRAERSSRRVAPAVTSVTLRRQSRGDSEQYMELDGAAGVIVTSRTRPPVKKRLVILSH